MKKSNIIIDNNKLVDKESVKNLKNIREQLSKESGESEEKVGEQINEAIHHITHSVSCISMKAIDEVDKLDCIALAKFTIILNIAFFLMDETIGFANTHLPADEKEALCNTIDLWIERYGARKNEKNNS